jgi:hypothetical protein
MRSSTLFSLLGGLAGTALATCEHEAPCPEYTIDTCAVDNSHTCLPPQASLATRDLSRYTGFFRRTCESEHCAPAECPASQKVCTPGGPLPPQLTPQTIPLICGQKPTSNSVVVSYEDATRTLVFDLVGAGLEKPKLQIEATRVTNHAPGQFRYNTYCSATQCVVPIDEVITTECLDSLCNATLWVALHTGIGGETCWADGERIYGDRRRALQGSPSRGTLSRRKNDKNEGNGNGNGNGKGKGNGSGNANNWATQFSITFSSCPSAPQLCCCCAS